MNERLREKHEDTAVDVRPTGRFNSNAKRFVCPATAVAITDATCRNSRKAAPDICANCLIPLASTTCDKCGRPMPEQEASAGFTTCEFCGYSPSVPLYKSGMEN